jgi:protein involved in sex pheromone biosynthesis
MRFSLFILVGAVVLLSGCTRHARFKIGDYLMPKGATSVSAIVKVVAVEEENYKVFTHFLSNGSLIVAQDYQLMPRPKVESEYALVEAPKTDGTFSPDKYLSKP